MAVVEEHTWAPALASKPELPRKDDRENYSKEMNVPVEAMKYSNFVKQGRWGEVDEVLRGVYKEASEKLSHYWERAYLLDYMLGAGHLGTAESARHARLALVPVVSQRAGNGVGVWEPVPERRYAGAAHHFHGDGPYDGSGH